MLVERRASEVDEGKGVALALDSSESDRDRPAAGTGPCSRSSYSIWSTWDGGGRMPRCVVGLYASPPPLDEPPCLDDSTTLAVWLSYHTMIHVAARMARSSTTAPPT